ncbi:uncharacterized protein LOC111080924 isoform X2 [Drosophila obscura]|uniref:uncharacterized protein LOC111080924 isoform X2 n=1 Tax=Drosophila obscura TaxID=7282 RepID=UPI001BB22AD1|nr:uncharacterized protein LOC111080924 isoform X2 [Drosophila obscura]
MLLTTCCGCCGLRYGCFLVAIYMALTYLLQLLALLMYGFIEEYAESQIFYLFLSLPCCIGVAVSVVLFVGALRQKKNLLCPWLITFSAFAIVFTLMLIGSLIAGFSQDNVEDNHIGLGFMRRPLIQTFNLLHLYVVLVVFSYYFELKNENIF